MPKKVKENEHVKKAQFEDLHSIQIGKYWLNENDLKEKFGDDDDTIVLLKRVFQKEYPITRTNNIPRVPSRLEDKHRIISSLEKYFNELRAKILEMKFKSGDSVSLRENIDALQQIKLLLDHFEESNETFPYHMFKDYLENKEYIKNSGDVNKQMRDFQFSKSQNERIRNLLRQFSLLYLQNNKLNNYDIKDPGIYANRFQEFINERDISKIPPILRELLLLLDGKHSVVALEDQKIRDEAYNPSKVYDELTRLLDEIDKDIEEQKGGAKPYLDKQKGTKGLDDQITSVVDHILDKYKYLRQAQKHVIVTKDAEYDMLDNLSTQKILDLEGKLIEAESNLSSQIKF